MVISRVLCDQNAPIIIQVLVLQYFQSFQNDQFYFGWMTRFACQFPSEPGESPAQKEVCS
jgi:hypothetical protein